MQANFRRLVLAASLALAGAAPAAADEDREKQLTCSAYAKMGAVVADISQSLTDKQKQDFKLGVDPELIGQLFEKMLTSLSEDESTALASAKSHSRHAFISSYSDTTFALLESGKASTPEEIYVQLTKHCQTNMP